MQRIPHSGPEMKTPIIPPLFSCLLLLVLVESGCEYQADVFELPHENSDHYQPNPVALNRGPAVLDGFRGDVHPLLHGQTKLEVTAHWTPVGKGREKIHENVPEEVYRLFRDLRVAKERHTYTEREFSAFLPDELGSVGQIWSLDLDKVIGFLKQFHPNPSMHLVAKGRRAGPDGAFAVLRAVSPTHLDIVYRIHAEFDLTPKVSSSPTPLVGAWYTPSYFAGRVLVNRKTGTVDHFQLALPAEKSLNVHLTVAHPRGSNRDIVRVGRMELIGGNSKTVDDINWVKEMHTAEAHRKLKTVFYKFMEIDWVPTEQALAVARERKKPIFAVVLWGALDDQSC